MDDQLLRARIEARIAVLEQAEREAIDHLTHLRVALAEQRANLAPVEPVAVNGQAAEPLPQEKEA